MHPNVILATAIYAGLTALVRLARRRTNKWTSTYLDSILTIWNETKSEFKRSRLGRGKLRLDFTPIRNAEANMRRLFLSILWHSTRRFGNKEFKRVYKWVEGTVGPLNALLNYLGARLRDLAMTKYPFPEPEFFQVRVYPDGTRLVIGKRDVAKYLQDDAKEVYWKAGYIGNRKHPTVLLAHPTLPGMDFVDMIRCHGMELVRQCFIHSVPRSEAHRYIRLLLHRLTPFLDYIYTEGKTGRDHFKPEADKELRALVLEIRSRYSRQVGQRKSITSSLGEDLPEPGVEFLDSKVQALLEKTRDAKEQERYQKVLDYIDQSIIVDRDIEKLYEHVRSLSQREGNEWHRVLLSDLHHPKSLRSVVFAGDTMLEKLSTVLAVGELPVTGHQGAGKVDITVFIRRSIKGQVFWTPVMVLEVKTKSAFDFNLYGVRHRKESTGYPPALYAWKRSLSEAEWEMTAASPPIRQHMDQLQAYERALLGECRNMIPDQVRLPKSLWKGVIALDSNQDYEEVFRAFNTLLEDLISDVGSNDLETAKPLAYALGPETDTTPPRLGLFLEPGDDLRKFIAETSPPVSLQIEDPFTERVSDDRLLTLYIPVSSPTSSGNAAAWVSKNWHLLNHIEEVTRRRAALPDVYWLDLLGDYRTSQLVRRRFGLDALLKKRQITKRAHSRLTTLLESIAFIDLSECINTALSRDSRCDSISVSEWLTGISSDSAGALERIIIIDGWAELKEMLPATDAHLLREVEMQLLEALPSHGCNVIWVDQGVSDTRMNRHYQDTCVRPLAHDSPRRFHVDEIIYNVPSSPRSFGWQTPRQVNTRFIIQDTPTSAAPWRAPINVPHLKGWKRVFRGLSRRDGLVTEAEVYGGDSEREPMYGRKVTLGNIQSRMSRLTAEEMEQEAETAMTLIPSLQRPRGHDAQREEGQSAEVSWQRVPVPITSNVTPSLAERMAFAPDRPPPRPPRSTERYVDSSKITRRWYYERAPKRAEDEEFKAGKTRRPPLYRLTGLDEVDSLATRRREVQRLWESARYLMKRTSEGTPLFRCSRDIAIRCGEALSEPYDEDTLLVTMQKARDIILRDADRARLWESVEQPRESIGDVLTSDNRAVLKMAQEMNPDVLSLYGNNLFLAIIAVLSDDSDGWCSTLWKSIAEWELYQMGFRSADYGKELAQSQYDFQYIYSSLLFRLKHMRARPAPQKAAQNIIYGQLIWMEREGKYDAWLVFPDGERPLLGLAQDLNYAGLKIGWRQCVTEPASLRTSVLHADESSDRTPIALSLLGETRVLWVLGEVDGEEQWIDPAVIDYDTSKEDKRVLRWFRLSFLPEALLPQVEKVRPPIAPAIDSRVNTFLSGAFRARAEVEEVTCRVSLDFGKRCYRVEFSSGHSFRLRDTYALIRLLKYPYLKGAPLRTRDGKHLFWDHRNDIEYDSLYDKREGKDSIIDLSFLIPFVHRASFFMIDNLLPMTCAELLDMNDGGAVTLVAEANEAARNRGGFRFISVKLDGMFGSSQLRSLESEELNSYDLELLAECKQLVDRSTMTRFDLELDVDQLRGLRVALSSDTSRLSNALDEELEQEELAAASPEGEWLLSCVIKSASVQWSLRSPLTHKAWTNRTFRFPLDGAVNLEVMVNTLVGELKKIHFAKKNIINYRAELNNLRETLRSLGWGSKPPVCHAEATRDGDRLRIQVWSQGEQGLVVYDEEFIVDENDSAELVIEDLNDNALSGYNIENTEEFEASISELLDREEAETEGQDDEETELLANIREYKEEGQWKAVAAQTNNLVEYYIRVDRFDDALQSAEENITLIEGMGTEDEDTKWYLFIAQVLKAEALQHQDKVEDSAKQIQKAFVIIPPDTSVGLLRGVRKTYFEKALKLRGTPC